MKIIELQNINSVLSMADWVELNVMYTSSPLSKSKISSLISGSAEAVPDETVESDEDDEDDYTNHEGENYQLYDSVLQELKRRLKLYGDQPPFRIVDNVVIPILSWEEAPELFMCLLFAYWGAWNKHSATKLFERLSNEVLVSYLGGRAITLGFPNPDNLSNQLDTLAGLLFENRGMNPAFADKDRGVDVVGWKSFGDGRNGQIIMLMQCAAGRNWDQKKQIPVASWCRYINWNYHATLPCMSLTEIITVSKWQNRIDDYVILFDRARIYQNIYRPSFPINQPLRDEILEWCALQV